MSCNEVLYGCDCDMLTLFTSLEHPIFTSEVLTTLFNKSLFVFLSSIPAAGLAIIC